MPTKKNPRPSLFDPSSFSPPITPAVKKAATVKKMPTVKKAIIAKKAPTVKKTIIAKKAVAVTKTSYRPEQSLLKRPLLIVAGEHSGDILGGDVVKNLRSIGFDRFIGTGGDLMQSQKVEILERIENMTTVGIVEALVKYRRLNLLAKKLVKKALAQRVQTAVLIDYPGFNLRLAAVLKEKGIRVVYLVSPQIWAWHYSRIHAIKKNVDLMLVLFPFEKDLYTLEGIQSHCIGHPLLYRLPDRLVKEESIPLAFSKKKKKTFTIGLFPGSRSSEIKRLLPSMLQAAELFYDEFPNSSFLLAGINADLTGFVQSLLKGYAHLPIRYYFGRSLRIMEASDALILASGTVTLEAAYFKKPMIVLYRVGWFNFFFLTALLRVRCLCIVNILAQKQIISEILQTEITPEVIVEALKDLFQKKEHQEKVSKELETICKELTSRDPARKAAVHIAKFLQ